MKHKVDFNRLTILSAERPDAQYDTAIDLLPHLTEYAPVLAVGVWKGAEEDSILALDVPLTVARSLAERFAQDAFIHDGRLHVATATHGWLSYPASEVHYDHVTDRDDRWGFPIADGTYWPHPEGGWNRLQITFDYSTPNKVR